MAFPWDVYDPAVAVKRTPDDAEAAIERTPLPAVSDVPVEMGGHALEEGGDGGILDPPDDDALRRAPEIVVDAVERWVPGSMARSKRAAARRPRRSKWIHHGFSALQSVCIEPIQGDFSKSGSGIRTLP